MPRSGNSSSAGCSNSLTRYSPNRPRLEPHCRFIREQNHITESPSRATNQWGAPFPDSSMAADHPLGGPPAQGGRRRPSNDFSVFQRKF